MHVSLCVCMVVFVYAGVDETVCTAASLVYIHTCGSVSYEYGVS